MNETAVPGANGPSTLMTRLREETMPLHRETEQGSLQQDLLAGRLPLGAYADLLQQLLVLHRAIERALVRQSAHSGPIGAVVREYQFQESHLLRDLRHYGRDPEPAGVLPAVREMIVMIDETERSRATALLGVHYVLEGSKNGGRFIARAVRKAYNLEGGDGLAYLDPYGELQGERWREFKGAMDALPLSAEEQDAIVAAAGRTFQGIMNVHREVYAAAGTAPA